MKALILILMSGLASASELSAPEYEQFYLNSAGQKVESAKAIVDSVKGETVYKCQSVQAKVSKSGTSIGIKNVKKPRVIK